MNKILYFSMQPTVVEATTWISCPLENAFDGASAAETLPDIFPGSGAVPGVISAVMEDGTLVMEEGKTRIVTTSDGKTVKETYTFVDRPNAYKYVMSDLNPPLSLILSKAIGEWRFSRENDGTRVNWRYLAYPVNAVARPPSYLIVRGFLLSAMQKCLNNLKQMIELDLPPRWIPDDTTSDCPSCKKPFTLFFRRHHCRACGGLFCEDCAHWWKPLPQFGLREKVRVCEPCFRENTTTSELDLEIPQEDLPRITSETQDESQEKME